MLSEVFRFRPENPDVTLTSYIADSAPELNHVRRPAIVVFPGGGYQHLSPREAEPVAMQFFAAGFQAFVLRYSVGENAKFPNALVDASMPVAHVRMNADRYNIDPERIFVVGFSAGGHLAATLGTMYDSPYAAFDGMPAGANRPSGMILSYAPTSVRTEKIANSFTRTLQMEREALEQYSPENLVTANTPPAYIWHTATDPVVPVEHAIYMASALAAAGVSFEAHIFPKGPHGIALATAQTCNAREDYIVPDAAQWVSEAIEWANRL